MFYSSCHLIAFSQLTTESKNWITFLQNSLLRVSGFDNLVFPQDDKEISVLVGLVLIAAAL